MRSDNRNQIHNLQFAPILLKPFGSFRNTLLPEKQKGFAVHAKSWLACEKSDVMWTIRSKMYCFWLRSLKRKKKPALINRKDVVLYYENAWANNKHDCWKSAPIGLGSFFQPAKSFNVTLSDLVFANIFLGNNNNNNECPKNALTEYFASKSQTFYNRGIKILYEQWAQVLK